METGIQYRHVCRLKSLDISLSTHENNLIRKYEFDILDVSVIVFLQVAFQIQIFGMSFV